MRLLLGAASDKGRVRLRNEDWMGWRLPLESPSDTLGSLFVVADGVGGHRGGADASRIAVETIVSEYYAQPSVAVTESLTIGIYRANEAVYAGGQGGGRATTLVAAVVAGDTLYIAHVGDSRALLIRGGTARQLTSDHSVVQEMVKQGILTPEQAEHDPYRHVISRWIGDRSARPDITVEHLEPDDRLLLCTDGLTNQVSLATIADVLLRSSEQEGADELIRVANAAGGVDNATAIVVHVVAASEPE